MIKRCFDIAVSGLGLVALAPLLLIIAAMVALKLGRPVIFAQQRPGRHGHIFTLYKFRSMDSGGAPDAQRLSAFGRFLRSTSLDELPELWNVLKGDLSLVGPRPLLVEYLPLYSSEQARRHEVRPGLTGWAQINGRNAISWEQKFALDVWYVDNRSLWLDLRIVLLTLVRAFNRDGVSAPGEATVTRFAGSAAQRAARQ